MPILNRTGSSSTALWAANCNWSAPGLMPTSSSRGRMGASNPAARHVWICRVGSWDVHCCPILNCRAQLPSCTGFWRGAQCRFFSTIAQGQRVNFMGTVSFSLIGICPLSTGDRSCVPSRPVSTVLTTFGTACPPLPLASWPKSTEVEPCRAPSAAGHGNLAGSPGTGIRRPS